MIGMDVLDREGINLATVCNESGIVALQSYSKYFQGYTFLLVRRDLRLRKYQWLERFAVKTEDRKIAELTVTLLKYGKFNSC